MKILDQLRSSELKKNVAVLMTGNGLAQVVVFVFAPILSRIFTPAEIGIYASVLGFVNLFVVIASLRYERSIVLAKNEKEAINLFVLSSIITLSLSLLFLIMVYVIYLSNAQIISGNLNESWSFAIPLIAVIQSSYLITRYYSIYYKKFKAISLTMPIESTLKGIASILLGYFLGGGVGSLIVGGLIGGIVALLILIKNAKPEFQKMKSELDYNLMKKLAKQHYKFPLFEGPNALLYSFSQQGIMIFLPKLFSEGITGFYSYTNRILLTPIQFFSGSYAQVTYKKLSDLKLIGETQYLNFISKSTNQICYLFIVPFIIFVLCSKYYIPIIFGEDWIELYRYMYLLGPYSFLILISPAFSNAFTIDNKHDVSLWLKIVFVIFRLGILFLGSHLGWNFLFTLFCFSILSALATLLNYFVYYRKSLAFMPKSIYLYIFVCVAAYLLLFHYFNFSF